MNNLMRTYSVARAARGEALILGERALVVPWRRAQERPVPSREATCLVYGGSRLRRHPSSLPYASRFGVAPAHNADGASSGPGLLLTS